MSLLEQCVAIACHATTTTPVAEQLAERGARFHVNWLDPGHRCELYAQRRDSHDDVWVVDVRQLMGSRVAHARCAMPPNPSALAFEWAGSFEPWVLRSLSETLERLPWAPMAEYVPLLLAERLAARMPQAEYDLREFAPNAGFNYTIYAYTPTQSVGIKLRLLPHNAGVDARFNHRDTRLATPRELLDWLCATLQPYIDAAEST